MTDSSEPSQKPKSNDRGFKKDISFISIDCDESYFSTKEQIRLKDTSYFVDRSIARAVSGSINVAGLFGRGQTRAKSSITPKSHNYLSSSVNLDSYRNGIEITNFNHWIAGTVKISAGTPGHLIKPLCLGVSEISVVDKDYYQEIDIFNPIYFIGLQEEDKPIENMITFPIVTNDSNQLENYVLNGIIEPFPIRPIISKFSINVPFEPQGVRGQFGSGNSTMFLASDYITSVDYYEPTRQNNNVFLDLGEDITMQNDEGDVVRHLGSSIFYFNDGVNYLAPFEDKVPPRGTATTSNYTSDLIEVVNKMRGQGTTYISKKEKSASTGFMYDNISQNGTDSIAYGGLTY